MMKGLLKAARNRPPATFGAATLLAIAMMGYTGFVGYTGGLVNPRQPKSHSDVMGDVVEHLALRQSHEALMEQARQPPRQIRTVFGSYTPSDYYFSRIPEVIGEHKEHIEGNRPLGSRWSYDLETFLRSEIRELPEHARVGVPGVRPQSVLFEKGEFYEMLAASTIGSARLFEDYLRVLVNQRWLADELYYDEGGRRGYISAQSRGMTLTITISEQHVYPEMRTTVLWELAIFGANGGGSGAAPGNPGGGKDLVPVGDGESSMPRAPGNKRGPH